MCDIPQICSIFIFLTGVLTILKSEIRVSAFLYQSVFQLYKAMYYQLSLVAIQICVVGFIFHNEHLRFIFHYIFMFKKLRHCAIAACMQLSYLLIKPLVLDRLHGNSYEISAYKEIQ